MTDHQTAQRLLAMEDVLILTRLRLCPVLSPAPAGQDRLGAAQ